MDHEGNDAYNNFFSSSSVLPLPWQARRQEQVPHLQKWTAINYNLKLRASIDRVKRDLLDLNVFFQLNIIQFEPTKSTEVTAGWRQRSVHKRHEATELLPTAFRLHGFFADSDGYFAVSPWKSRPIDATLLRRRPAGQRPRCSLASQLTKLQTTVVLCHELNITPIVYRHGAAASNGIANLLLKDEKYDEYELCVLLQSAENVYA
uniref:p0044F08.12 protein n=1 Tax=Oryza sativa subsp. japonica TaxID=39947 RepID=Q9AWV0_ORYSJ|nr:P0044F08.12 [Oryza sativa Japonica Group]